MSSKPACARCTSGFIPVRRSAWLIVPAIIAVWVGWSLPPSPLAPEAGSGDTSIPGVVHVHTSRSDGRSSPETIAAIAAQAGLKFVILTDHGDATRQPDAPAYVSGVLVIDAVEISTDSGHLVALNLPQAPYPLAGEARDVLEDVHRLGGFAVAAHPDSPKPDLRWDDWEADLDGIELLNLDTAWRARAAGGWRDRVRLLQAASTYLFRPAPSIATLTTNERALQARWSALAHNRHLAIFSGADAHARLDLRSGSSDGRFSLALPSYRAVFQTMSTRVRTAEPLTGDAGHDAEQIVKALTAGHAYTAFDALLTPPAFSFEASAGSLRVTEGESIAADGEVTLTVTTNAPLPFKALLFRNGDVVQEASASVSPTWRVPPEPAVYRVEIHATDRSPEQLWLMSNAIAVNLPPARSRDAEAASSGTAAANATVNAATVAPRVFFDGRTAGTWTSESAAASKTAVNVIEPVGAGPRELLFRYALPGGRVVGQYAAAVVNTSGGIAPYRAVTFTARAEAPIRLSVQLRQEGSDGQGWRWQRTVFLDASETTRTLRLDDFRPMGPTLTPRAPLEHVSSVLLAVDQTNTSPGSAGRVWFKRVALE